MRQHRRISAPPPRENRGVQTEDIEVLCFPRGTQTHQDLNTDYVELLNSTINMHDMNNSNCFTKEQTLNISQSTNHIQTESIETQTTIIGSVMNSYTQTDQENIIHKRSSKSISPPLTGQTNNDESGPNNIGAGTSNGIFGLVRPYGFFFPKCISEALVFATTGTPSTMTTQNI